MTNDNDPLPAPPTNEELIDALAGGDEVHARRLKHMDEAGLSRMCAMMLLANGGVLREVLGEQVTNVILRAATIAR